MRSTLYLVIGLIHCALAIGQPTPVLTVCEALRDIKTYNGKDVAIVGLAGWTFEGTFLSERCEPDGYVQVAGHRWLSMIALAGGGQVEPPVNLNEELLLRKLAEVQKTTERGPGEGPLAAHWMVAQGRLVSPSKLISPRPTGGRNKAGNGFGANGSVPARLDLTSSRGLGGRP